MQAAAEIDALEARRRVRVGLALALSAYSLWGVMPLYFRWLGEVSALEIVAHRIVWSIVLLLGIVVVTGRLPLLRAVLRDRRRLGRLALTGLLIGTNWFLFIFSIEIERVVEASLGYFVNPLLNVALGFAVLGERMRSLQLAAIALAALGVSLEALALGHPPWIAIALAASFGLYGLMRKLWPEDPFVGLLVEAICLLPAAGAVVLWLARSDGLVVLADPTMLGPLMLAGVVTTAPLLCFSGAAPRLRLSTLGFIQYIAPSTTFLLAVFVFLEPFALGRLWSFGCIWLALAVFTSDAWYADRRRPAFERA